MLGRDRMAYGSSVLWFLMQMKIPYLYYPDGWFSLRNIDRELLESAEFNSLPKKNGHRDNELE